MLDVPAYAAFLPPSLLDRLRAAAEPVPGVPGLTVRPDLRADFPDVLTDEALAVVAEVYRAVRGPLRTLLERRVEDRARLDDAVRRCAEEGRTHGIPWGSPDHPTPFGLTDGDRVVLGPVAASPASIEVPDFLRGEQVTLFGPPDTPKMAINAMNALHRRPADEPAIVTELVEASGERPRWGADDEDSKTPLPASLMAAQRHLIGCFEGTLRHAERGKEYALAEHGRSRPIKRIPGLALPDTATFVDGSPLPLHVLDLVLHCWHLRRRPEAQVVYVPKLETEEEAAYLKALLQATQAAIAARDPAFDATIRVFLVFENPRAILRLEAMVEALQPHFVGGSLGWHDYLASAARLFRHAPGYRIPVKADPDIVIRHIAESHVLLADTMQRLGGISIGGMYGILPLAGDAASQRATMIGYVRDVVTQLRRGLTGFWVAHPDFVRPGIALVEAFRRRQRDPADDALERLLRALVPAPDDERLLAFVAAPDAERLDPADPNYPRALLAADLAESPVVANHNPEEVRYNVFQALQYLADWLQGNGCVALPATLQTDQGPAHVRVMDDLATTERSRWELWAEVAHGRVSVEQFDAIVEQECRFLQGGPDAGATPRQVQVPWAGEHARWYPIARRLLRQLVLDPQPAEFVTELTLPFVAAPIRSADDPWAAARALCPGKYA